MILLKNISKSLPNQHIPIINNINLDINRGDFISIIGPSGSGKSTLLNILSLFDTPTSGDYFLDGTPLTRLSSAKKADIRKNKIGFIFQSFMLLPRKSVIRNVELPLLYTSMSRKERQIRCQKAIHDVDLENKTKQKALELSGGEKQRVAIARAIVNNPDLLLADEPTGNLDDSSKQEILDIFVQLKQQGRTIIMVTHDLDAARVADRCFRLQRGELLPYPFDERAYIGAVDKPLPETTGGKNR